MDPLQNGCLRVVPTETEAGNCRQWIIAREAFLIHPGLCFSLSDDQKCTPQLTVESTLTWDVGSCPFFGITGEFSPCSNWLAWKGERVILAFWRDLLLFSCSNRCICLLRGTSWSVVWKKEQVLVLDSSAESADPGRLRGQSVPSWELLRPVPSAARCTWRAGVPA